MTTMIDYTYEMTDKETRLNELQNECKLHTEIIEALEELRGNAEVSAEELEAAIAEAHEAYNKAEQEIVNIVFKN